MSLLMLKTKNLSWQDHTLNIEVMLAPLRSTLLLNKHKTLDTKANKEKSLYDRQKEACLKDFVVESRLIERRRQTLLKRKKDITQEKRIKSALDQEREKQQANAAATQARSTSAPSDCRERTIPTEEMPQPRSSLPKLTLRHTPLFGANFLRPRIFLETAPDLQRQTNVWESSGSSVQTNPTADNVKEARQSGKTSAKSTSRSQRDGRLGSSKSQLKTPEIPTELPGINEPRRGISRRIPNVQFLQLLDQDDSDEELHKIVIEVKDKTLEDKVRQFLLEMDEFNIRPPTASSGTKTEMSSAVSSGIRRGVPPNYMVINAERKKIEKAFDRYCQLESHDELLKAMKLAAKMKTHIRQAKSSGAVSTMASMKSSKSFMRVLKRQQRKEKHAHIA